MNDQEMEELITKLNQRINIKDNKFTLDQKTKNELKQLNFFHQIMIKYPDRGDAIMNAIISNLYIRKYNQFEIIWDDNKKNLNGIFIVLLGMVNVYIYNFQNKSKSNEIKMNLSLKKLKNNKDNTPLKHNKKDMTLKNNNLIIEDLKPLKIDYIAKKGDSIGNSFLQNIEKNDKYKNKYKKHKNNEDINQHFYKIESKTKSIIGYLNEDDFNIIFEKLITKERHERMDFIHKINYMPKDPDFIEKFQNQLIKKVFFKKSLIIKQNEEFRTFYIIKSGSVRLTIDINRHFFCSLDFDVLIGKHINDRFTSSRVYEISGNYREKEKFIIVDLGEGEIIGGIEFCKDIKKYMFTAECITDVILYEINIKYFNSFLKYWSFYNFYKKINTQLDYFINRISSINDFRKEKSKKDDYSFSQNRFIKTFQRGHPISEKKKEYIEKYTNPFKFEKGIKNREFKTIKTRYIKDYKIIQKRNKNKQKTISTFISFITNLSNYQIAKKTSKLNKSKTIINFKLSKTKTKLDDILENKERKEEEKNNDNINNDNKYKYKYKEKEEEEPKKIINKNKIIKSKRNVLSACIRNKNKNVRKFNERRQNSCIIENKLRGRMNHNSSEINISNPLKNKSKNNSTKSILILKGYNPKNKHTKYLEKSVETFNKYSSDNTFNNKTISKQNIMENYTEDSNKNISNNLKMSFSTNENNSLYNKLLSPQFFGDNRDCSQPFIQHKSLVFPSGIQKIKELNNHKIEIINELLSSFISNSYIRKELKYKQLNDFFMKNYPNNNNKKKIKIINKLSFKFLL
jgi:CRP-like cAMP-binding protein